MMAHDTFKIFIVPGLVGLAALLSRTNLGDWFRTEFTGRYLNKVLRAYGLEAMRIKIVSVTIPPLKMDRFTAFARALLLCFYFPSIQESQKYSAALKLIIRELDYEYNRRIYGLVNSITPREMEVLEKRIVEKKSITETASEMKIKPQGVVALSTSLKKRVRKHLAERKGDLKQEEYEAMVIVVSPWNQP